jgi:hypothetical protein
MPEEMIQRLFSEDDYFYSYGTIQQTNTNTLSCLRVLPDILTTKVVNHQHCG